MKRDGLCLLNLWGSNSNDIYTGEIKLMVSVPGYDPNLFFKPPFGQGLAPVENQHPHTVIDRQPQGSMRRAPPLRWLFWPRHLKLV